MQNHEIETIAGQPHCRLCGRVDVWGECPGVTQYFWESWPEGLFTAKQLAKERLTPGERVGAIWYPKAADGSGWLWLYRKDEATAKAPLSTQRREGIEKAKATRRRNLTCVWCGVYVPGRSHRSLGADGYCEKCGLPAEGQIARWQAQGLIPMLGEDILVWKHVTRAGIGNMGFCYHLYERFQIPTTQGPSMGCAGPMGALRDWHAQDENPHVLALRTPRAQVRIRDSDGVFLFRTGVPVALYRAKRIDDDTVDLHLVEGMDALALIR
jgi:hypothetical protein